MKTNSVVLVLLVGLAFVQCKEVKYKDCGSTAKILSVEIEPCDSEPCVFKRGNETTIRFSLVSDQDSETATLDARMKVFGMWLPIPGVEKNLCKSTIQCPIVKGNTYPGLMTVIVPRFMPSLSTDVQIKIAGDKGVSVCIRSEITIG
ncbi:mite group 2 allergen-like Ixo r 2 isoform X1 [Dermacentor variabilis]|uniref:mite group 2 allergen-like Ixo r 2 isoform X1 n=1 Tax=Dermacentor variabilis TaxID=34621 RepID=UPI003F5AE7B2